ncbi:hypothetical protein [Micromonospora sp. NPDC050695]|uniref:hypothetical protein n=1 Tax=Micromonospora sp. NPDC050695 TaxID=3154938 RepID=UPI0033EEE0CA
MGLFSRTPQPEPVRRDTVMNLIKLGMAETDAADRDIDSTDFDQAKERFELAMRDATPAETTAAFDALRRHGY